MMALVFCACDVDFRSRIRHLLVPIDPNTLSTFDPCKDGVVPTLNELVQQVEQLPKQNQQNEDANQEKLQKQKDYNQTSLKPFVDIFTRFVQRAQTSRQEDVLAKSDLNTMLSGEI